MSAGRGLPAPAVHGGAVPGAPGLPGGEAGEALDFSINVNPWGMSPKALAAARAALAGCDAYPDRDCSLLRPAIVSYLGRTLGARGLDPSMVHCSAGATDALFRLAAVLAPRRALVCAPTFAEYARALGMCGCEVVSVPLGREDGYAQARRLADALDPTVDIVFACEPNNPTGTVDARRDLEALLSACERAGAVLVVDECFNGFLDGPADHSLAPLVPDHPSLVVLRAFTKVFGMAGLRLGYVLCGDRGVVDGLARAGDPWVVSTVAQAAGLAALGDEEYLAGSLAEVRRERPRLARALRGLGLHVVDGSANFLLFRHDSPGLPGRLAKRGVLVRDCSDFSGLGPGWARVAVRRSRENDELVRALAGELGSAPAGGMAAAAAPAAPVAVASPPAAPDAEAARPAPSSSAPSRAAVLMVQGTMSNAGKSVLVAGLCRAFTRRGLSVAPFKGQNMSLNSGVTPDGREVGRAQVLQAHACGLEPDARMNPVLLKPASDVGSQVLLMGRPVANLGAREYGAFRASLRSGVAEALESLRAEHDLVVIEGAGSPAEINLDDTRDLANMGVARMADAPVVLVGDIDPGGVFAQLKGTVDLLRPEDRARVAGLVINKFRGDREILRPGLSMLEDLCGVPVLGVVPWVDLDLPDEDGLSARARRARGSLDDIRADEEGDGAAAGLADVAVLALPRVSNATDLAPLERHPRARVRWVGRPAQAGRPDLLVVPGSKATLSDLRWMRSNGLDRVVCALAGSGVPVLGVCGGYQMLGTSLEDPTGADGGGSERGLGLLPVRTVMGEGKRLARVEGAFAGPDGVPCRPGSPSVGGRAASGDPFAALAGIPVSGYEVHMGATLPDEEEAAPTDVPGFSPGGAGAPVSRPLAHVADAGSGGGPRAQGTVVGAVAGTYVHGLLDAPGAADALVGELLRRKGLGPGPGGAASPGARQVEDRELDRLADVLERCLDIDRLLRIALDWGGRGGVRA